MKCPECDLEQPDNTVLCSQCGLSFEAWRAMNPEPVKKKTAPEPEMTFPVPEEDEPEPEEEPEEPKKPSQGKTKEEPAKEKIPKEKKPFQWTKLHSIGLGLVAAAVLAALFLTHHSSPPAVTPLESTPQPTVNLTPDASTTPGAAVGAVINTLVTPTPIITEPSVKNIPVNTPTPAPKTAPAAAHTEPQAPSPTPVSAEKKEAAEKPTTVQPEKPAASSGSEPVTLEMPTDDEAATPTPEPSDPLESNEPSKRENP